MSETHNMGPVPFPEQNKIFRAPEGMPNCVDLPVWQGEAQDGSPVILSCWQPTREDIVRIAAGAPIWLGVYSRSLPPVCVTVTNPFDR